MLTILCLSANGRTAAMRTHQAPEHDGVLTTAATLRGRNVFVDSNVDEPVDTRFDEVVIDPVAR